MVEVIIAKSGIERLETSVKKCYAPPNKVLKGLLPCDGEQNFTDK